MRTREFKCDGCGKVEVLSGETPIGYPLPSPFIPILWYDVCGECAVELLAVKFPKDRRKIEDMVWQLRNHAANLSSVSSTGSML